MEKKRNFRPLIAVISAVLILVLLLGFFTRLVQPKYMTDLVEGSMVSQFYQESHDHDVIFLGDSQIYAQFSPMEIYRQTGITAYLRATPQQLMWQSYYLLKETYRYETPKAVVLSVNAMRYETPQDEAFNRLSLDKMRWSSEKWDMIQASMMEDEEVWHYIFPLLRYHSRITELTQEDWDYLFKEVNNFHNGFLINKEVKPMGALPTKKPLAQYQFSDVCYDYLDKIRLLCEENGTELILVKAPSQYPFWYEEYDAQMEEYAAKHGLAYYNFLEDVETMGIDFQTDTYDGGLHLNLAGATKMSKHFASILEKNHDLPDRRSDPQIAARYEEKLALYDEACK
jgi:hypothetical protein